MHKHYLQKGLFDKKAIMGVINPAVAKVKKLFVKEDSPQKEKPIPAGRAKGSRENEEWGRMVTKGEFKIFRVPVNAAGNQKISYVLADRIRLASEDFKRAYPKDYEIMATKMQNSYRLFPEWRKIIKTKGKPAGQRFMRKYRPHIGKDGIWPAGGIYASGGGGHHDHPYMVDLAYPWTWLAEPEKHGLSKEGVKYFGGALNKQGLRYSKKDAKHLGNHISIPRRTLQKVQVALIKEQPKVDLKFTPFKQQPGGEEGEETQVAESSLPKAARGSAKERVSSKKERLIVSEAPKSKKTQKTKPLPKRTVKPYKVPKSQAKQRLAGVVQEKKPLRGPGKQRTRIARPRRYQAESFREA